MIAGFTVLQSIAVIYFAVQHEVLLKSWDRYLPVVIFGIFVGALLYAIAVRWCAKAEHQLRQDSNQQPSIIKLSRDVYIGRIMTVGIFNGLSISSVLKVWLGW